MIYTGVEHTLESTFLFLLMSAQDGERVSVRQNEMLRVGSCCICDAPANEKYEMRIYTCLSSFS